MNLGDGTITLKTKINVFWWNKKISTTLAPLVTAPFKRNSKFVDFSLYIIFFEKWFQDFMWILEHCSAIFVRSFLIFDQVLDLSNVTVVPKPLLVHTNWQFTNLYTLANGLTSAVNAETPSVLFQAWLTIEKGAIWNCENTNVTNVSRNFLPKLNWQPMWGLILETSPFNVG